MKIEDIISSPEEGLNEFIDRHGLCFHQLLSTLKPASEYNLEVNERILYLIGKISVISSSSWKYALHYFSEEVPPFLRFLEGHKDMENTPKRRKIQRRPLSDESVAWTTHRLVQTDAYFKDLWDWSSLSAVYPSILHNFNSETCWLLERCFHNLLDLDHSLHHLKYSPSIEIKIPIKSHSSKKELIPESKLVEIEGVSLKGSLSKDDTFVLVPSRKALRKSICLSISDGSPCLVSGPTGSGKTRFIEHIAQRLSRKKFVDFHSIRVTDQTDGRSLVGGYVCTEVPGQFVWQRGILTKAIMDGDWFLIEDVGKASPDVKSLLSQIIECNSLYISHFGESLKPSPGFHLFCTSSTSAMEQEDVLKFNHSPYHISLNAFSLDEISSVISSLFSQKLDVGTCTKMVKTYEIISKMDSMSRIRRNLSLRDLIKWCERISLLTNRDDVFFNGIDSLCQWIPNKHIKLEACHVIGRFVNYNQNEISHLLDSHYPKLILSKHALLMGRATLHKTESSETDPKFALTKSTSNLLEFLASAVGQSEPVLLIGETGVGKTSTVQYLCSSIGKKLRVVNMSQQSDNSDLLGAYKPVDTGIIVKSTRKKFEFLFAQTFSAQDNRKFLRNISLCVQSKSWSKVIQLFSHVCDKAIIFLLKSKNEELIHQWKDLSLEIQGIEKSLSSKINIMFSFVKGVLSEAIENGEWILLDEINLAESETLECLTDFISKEVSAVSSPENPELSMNKHPDFRIFACMNPPTDIGKANLPPSLRNQFTEYFINEPDEENELIQIVSKYLKDLNVEVETVQNIVDFYLMLKVNASKKLCAGNGVIPVFSLRTLCRALRIASRNKCSNIQRSIFEAFSVCFLTELDTDSYHIVLRLLINHLVNERKGNKFLKEEIPKPIQSKIKSSFVKIEGYWIHVGENSPSIDEKYILTKSVRKNLKDISRIVSNCDLPVLIQGETSVGKTSLITYLANASGNHCYRINNHEHTDIQEYIGTYTMDDSGLFSFKEGVLVGAMRRGDWIILDELNLAPTEVLEALNRVLDDNRELFIAETQTLVKAHKNFRLFATQNPAGIYGGRKVLSRAFRNRFIQLNFEEVPSDEIETIVEKSCDLPRSMSKKMVKIMTELQALRRSSAAFEGKRGYITLRDLFRWGRRFHLAAKTIKTDTFYDWNKHFAEEGYMVLVSRIRRKDEEDVIKEHIEKITKIKLCDEEILTFTSEKNGLATMCEQLFLLKSYKNSGIVWTHNAQRMAILLLHAIRFKEPVLLVGETGCGKTTIVQEIANFLKQNLKIINCHLHTETSDFLGGLRPSRDEREALFQWNDGPLIQTMKNGDILLVDEISLADDSVIERMNSVLEPSRKLLLAEKISEGESTEEITAKSSFQLIATMNPGGDFGKKELSPALRNRFFEVWCQCDNKDEDLHILIRKSLQYKFSFSPEYIIVDFLNWLKSSSNLQLSIRDLITWTTFINKTNDILKPSCSIIHGICLVLFDGYSMMNNLVQASTTLSFKGDCLKYFQSALKDHDPSCSCLQWIFNEGGNCNEMINSPTQFGIKPFVLSKTSISATNCKFSFKNKTTAQNAFKLLRGFCLNKPTLLEGLPGVGKSSIIESLAALSGNQLVRINLSDQTEISDLFGTDLPVESISKDKNSKQIFAWRDGPLLSALKAGHWILLDELNLATQSVLEGLNACLDHRGEIFVPELNKTFSIKTCSTKIFGCQNPFYEGGDRKGLPKSFLNRFVRINVNPLNEEDLLSICESKFPTLNKDFITKIISCIQELKNIMKMSSFVGSPWSINLRDVSRFCQVLERKNGEYSENYVCNLFETIFVVRFRTKKDQNIVRDIYRHFFSCIHTPKVSFFINKEVVKVGMSSVSRTQSIFNDSSLTYLPSQSKTLEHLMLCVENRFIPILVGTSGVGKSTIIKVASQLAGQELITISLSSGCDTNDLLGGFEQTDILQEIMRVRSKLIQSLKKMARKKSEVRDRIFNLVACLKKSCGLKDVASFFKLLVELKNGDNDFITELIEKEELNLLAKFERHGNTKFFKWIDSNLVQALIDGSWVLMDNANFCSSSVLDRLNGLLEDGGCLDLYEHGLVNGTHRKIIPHPNFRIFFTLNPKNGELSPAMRNRCVEIFLPDETLDNISKCILSSTILGSQLSTALMPIYSKRPYCNIIEMSKCFKELLLNGFTLKESLEHLNGIGKQDTSVESFNPQKSAKFQAIQCLSLSSDPFVILPMTQISILKDCIHDPDIIILYFLLFSTKEDLSFRVDLLKEYASVSTLSTLTEGFQLESLPLEKRAFLPFVKDEISDNLNKGSINIYSKLSLSKIKDLAFPPSSTSELKNAGLALQDFWLKIIKKLNLSRVNNDNWDLFESIFVFIGHMIRIIEEENNDNKISILTIIWIKLKSLLQTLELKVRTKEVDRYLSLHLENDGHSVDRHHFMENIVHSPNGFLDASDLDSFLDILKKNDQWQCRELNEMGNLKKTLSLSFNWFQLQKKRNPIPNNNLFSPLYNHCLTSFNSLKSRENAFVCSVAMKWEELTSTSPPPPLRQLMNDIVFAETDNITLGNFQEKIKDLKILQDHISRDYNILIRHDEDKNFAILHQAMSICNSLTSDMDYSFLNENVEKVRNLIQKISDRDNNALLYAELKMMVGLLMFRIGSQVSTIDIADKMRINLDQLEERSTQLKFTMNAADICNCLDHFYPQRSEFLDSTHPHRKLLLKSITSCVNDVEHIRNNIPFRKENYKSLLSDIIQIRETNGSLDNIISLFNDVLQRKENSEQTDGKAMSWIMSMIQFGKNIIFRYPSYIDIITPLLDGITSMVEGLSIYIDLSSDLTNCEKNINRIKSGLCSRYMVLNTDYFEITEVDDSDAHQLLLSNNKIRLDHKLMNIFAFDFADKYFSLGDQKAYESLSIALNQDFSSLQHLSLSPKKCLSSMNELPHYFNVFKSVRNLISLYFKESGNILEFLCGQVPSSNFLEIKSSVSEFLKVKKTTLDLLDNFPENPLLTDILTLVERILGFPARSPISKFQEGVALLLPKILSWNKNAPKIYNINSEPLDIIIFDWQKLELSNVEMEFSQILKNFGENSYEEMWRVFKSLNLGSAVVSKRKFMLACFRFLCTSNIGEFERRLVLSESLIKLFDPLCKELADGFDIILKYFQRCVPCIKKVIHDKIKELTKSVKLALKSEFISYRKYRSASKKTTYKKIVADFIEFLREGSFKYFRINSPFDKIDISSQSLPKFEPKYHTIADIKNECEHLEFFSSSEASLGDVKSLNLKSNRLLNDLLISNNISNAFSENLKEIIISYKDIPHKALIDDPKGFHKYSKLITEVLRTMKDIGISYKLGLIHDVGYINFATTQVRNYPEHLLQILMRFEELKEMFLNKSSKKKQLNSGVIQRIEGSVTHGVLYSSSMNSYCHSFDLVQKDLKDIITKLIGSNDGLENWFRWADKSKIALSDSSIENTRRILESLIAQSTVMKKDRVEAEKARKIILAFESQIKNIEGIRSKDDLSNKLLKLKEVSEKFNVIQSDLVSDILRDININRLIMNSHIEFYQKWMIINTGDEKIPNSNSLLVYLRKTCERILGIVQDYVKKLGSVKTDDIETFSEIRHVVSEEISLLKVSKVMKSFKNLASLAVFNSNNLPIISSIVPLMSTYLSILESSKIRCHNVALIFDEYLRSTLEVFIQFGDAEFKHQPEEEEDDQQNEGEDKGPKEGCGLGDGTGTDNVSSEIPNEDMLEGAERKEDQEDEKEDKDEEDQKGPEEDDGIEMQDDFDDGKFESKEEDEDREEDDDKDEEEELDKKEEDVDENVELDDDLWKDEDDEEPEDESKEDEKISEEKKDKSEKSRKNKEHKENSHSNDKEEENPDSEADENESDFEEKDNNELDKDDDSIDEEDKRKREDEEFSDGEELDLDVVDENKLDEHEPEDLNMDDMNIDDENEEDIMDMDKDDLDDYEKPDFEDPDVELDDDKTDEAGGDNSENDPRENTSNIPDGTKNETVEEDAAVNNQDSIDGTSVDAKSTESKPENESVERQEKSKANEKSKTANDKEVVSNLEIAHSNEEESQREEESKIYDNLPEEEEREEDPNVVETMDHKQLKDHSGKDKEEEDEKMDVDDSVNTIPKIENDKLPTLGAERPNESYFSSGLNMQPEINADIDFKSLTNTKNPGSSNVSHENIKEWTHVCNGTSSLSQNLMTKLRLLFEPTKANRLKGDYKSGKRLNMRKIIPYIASHFRKDKIWLKRTKVSKRDYHILFALDDSQSMSDNEANTMAIEALATVSQAFNVLEVGKLGVIKFGESAELVQPFKSGFTPEDGGRILQDFKFSQTKTSILSLVQESINAFMKQGAEVSNSLSQLLVIISDGRGVFHEGKDELLQALRKAASAKIFIMFVIVETKNEASILDIRFPVFDDSHNLLRIESYMDNFPFNYYILLKDMKSLPHTLCGALQQWFEMTNYK
ncbi:uncharacterized protein [Lepeophtheirus salmonis]|uniref:uncharacterized protein n=1 Tax=Lepeophtheirus salmonis TaxID=72036 RepID=UPI001AE1AA84|nr:midasin-like [Lepeophtheirus salmonis]